MPIIVLLQTIALIAMVMVIVDINNVKEKYCINRYKLNTDFNTCMSKRLNVLLDEETKSKMIK